MPVQDIQNKQGAVSHKSRSLLFILVPTIVTLLIVFLGIVYYFLVSLKEPETKASASVNRPAQSLTNANTGATISPEISITSTPSNSNKFKTSILSSYTFYYPKEYVADTEVKKALDQKGFTETTFFHSKEMKENAIFSFVTTTDQKSLTEEFCFNFLDKNELISPGKHDSTVKLNSQNRCEVANFEGIYTADSHERIGGYFNIILKGKKLIVIGSNFLESASVVEVRSINEAVQKAQVK